MRDVVDGATGFPVPARRAAWCTVLFIYLPLVVGCMPRATVTEVLGPVIVASESTREGLRGVAYKVRADGGLDVVAKAEVTGAHLRFARRGFEGAERDVPELQGSTAPVLLNLILFVAWATWENACVDDVDDVDDSCRPTWESWSDAPASARFAFDTVDVTGATRLTADISSAPALSFEKRATSCEAFPSYDGDQVCTGWTGRVFGVGGARDALPCCAAHDACYFDCPLEGEACNGTACIAACNERIAGCCADRGGDPATCATYEIATDLAGGRGRNGCGQAKAELFCAELDVDDSGCGVERCVCEGCHALFPDGPDCAACDCVNDCLPIDDDSCFVDGISHGVRACTFVDYGGVGCFKWTDTRCAVGEACVLEGGAPSCSETSCPSTNECDVAGALENACHAHSSGAYYRVCTPDTDGCLVWERVYCDVDGIGAGTCVVGENGPVCLGV